MFKYHCLHFLTTTFPPPTHIYLTPSILPPFGFVHESFIHVHLWPFPFFPTLLPSSLPSGYRQFVLNFNVSGYTLLACLLWIRLHLQVRSHGICLAAPLWQQTWLIRSLPFAYHYGLDFLNSLLTFNDILVCSKNISIIMAIFHIIYFMEFYG